MQKITRANLLSLFKMIENPTFIGLTYETTVKLSDGREIGKIAKGVFMCGQTAAKAYKKAGLPAPGPRRWGVHTSKHTLEHKGNNYVQLRQLKNSYRKSEFFDGKQVIRYKDIASLMPAKQQREEIMYFALNVQKIMSVSMFGQKYELVD